MTLFEITLPPPTDEADKSKGFKEFIGAMEQFYAGMQSIGEGKYNEKENYFVLEVALGNQSDEVVIYAVSVKGNPNPVIVPSTTVNTVAGFEVKDPLALPLAQSDVHRHGKPPFEEPGPNDWETAVSSRRPRVRLS